MRFQSSFVALRRRATHASLLGMLVLGAGSSFIAENAAATVVVIHPLDEMAHRADVVAHVAVRSQKIQREDGRVVTLTEIEILDGMKGTKKGDIETIYQVGGKLNGEVVNVVGTSKFSVGEEMVFFAMRHRDRLVSYGVGIGKFSVNRTDATVSIREEFGDVVAIDLAKPRAGAKRPTPRTTTTLDNFVAKVRADLAAPAPKQIQMRRLAPGKRQLLNPRAKGLYLKGQGPAPAVKDTHGHK